MGVNIHRGGATPQASSAIAQIMRNGGMRTARLDLIHGWDQTTVRDQVEKIRAIGGRAQVTLQISYQWDHSCNQNLQFVEYDAYEQTTQAVTAMKDLVLDYELLNETQLRPEIQNEVPWNSAGTATAPYAGKPCVRTLAAVLRGMSTAIREVSRQARFPLRIILGVVGRDFGFLEHMQQQGVEFDVVGWHVYPRTGDTSLLVDPWYGYGGPLAQLARFERPLHINEFNCGETYRTDYDNRADSLSTQACLESLARHLKSLKIQKKVALESVHLYELLDQPQAPTPENRFGLMYSLVKPKLQLSLASAFAGGILTESEHVELITRGLLSEVEIKSFGNIRRRRP